MQQSKLSFWDEGYLTSTTQEEIQLGTIRNPFAIHKHPDLR
jgi:hypothetical protein